MATIDVVRYPVVLFDLDGTVVDSGGIILASMRHATLTVLEQELSDEQLMSAVGGPGLEAQMRAFAPDRVEELVQAYREHNEPLHDGLESFDGLDEVLVRLKSEGRRLGIVSAKRRRTVELAFARVPLGHLFDVIVGGDDTERQKPDPQPLHVALDRLGAEAGDAAYVGDSPYDMKAAQAAGVYAVGVTWGGIHDGALLEDADVVVHTAEELLAVL
ncbi:MAG TPA: HAD-IA family hydrolase [Gaiellaceae bacterium]